MRNLILAFTFLLLAPMAALHAAAPPAELSATAYPSIQKAIDANPGGPIYVPAGDYEISKALLLRSDNSGLHGPGRIIQANPNEPIIMVKGATGVRLRDLTLTRPEGKMDTKAAGINATQCRDLRIDDVHVLDNRTTSEAGAIFLFECRESQIRGCIIENYCRISVDDRTAIPRDGITRYGYAFDCIDGTGILVKFSKATLIQGCRVVERRLLPTPEVQQKFGLGKFVKKNPVKGTFISQKTWDEGRVTGWNQSGAIVITSAKVTDFAQVLGNYIENAGKGLDIHADHVTISQNIVNNAHIGMKAMHGARNVIITGNQWTRIDLWAIGLMPGMASRPAEDGKPETDNSDGGSIIANNIISGFGHGNAHWMWGNEHSPFVFDAGQESDDPPLTDVIIQGNIVDCIGPPRYKFAVGLAGGAKGPKGLHFSGNIFAPGTAGIANTKLPE